MIARPDPIVRDPIVRLIFLLPCFKIIFLISYFYRMKHEKALFAAYWVAFIVFVAVTIFGGWLLVTQKNVDVSASSSLDAGKISLTTPYPGLIVFVAGLISIVTLYYLFSRQKIFDQALLVAAKEFPDVNEESHQDNVSVDSRQPGVLKATVVLDQSKSLDDRVEKWLISAKSHYKKSNVR